MSLDAHLKRPIVQPSMFAEAKHRFEVLMLIWAVLFGSGSGLLTLAVWSPMVDPLARVEPLLVFVWIGQALLFLFSIQLLRSREPDAESVIPLCVYKAAAGLGMLVPGLRPDLTWKIRSVAIGGSLLDLSMGAVTLLVWWQARPTAESRLRPIRSTQWISHFRTSRADSLIGATWAAVCLVVSFFGWVTDARSETTLHVVASGNLAGVYASLGVASLLSLRAPSATRSHQNLPAAGSVVASALLSIWCVRFEIPRMYSDIFVAAAVFHLAGAVWLGFVIRRSHPTHPAPAVRR